MNKMDSKVLSPSPYAAPDTPIASAKRMRFKVPRSEPRNDCATPKADPRNINQHTPERKDCEDGNNVNRKLSFKAKSKRSVPEPYTPSKNLFSPALRTDNELHPKHLRSHSNDDHLSGESSSDVDPLDISADSNSPADEIKQSSHIDEPEEDETIEVQGSEDDDEDGDMMVFNPYLFIAELPEHHTVVEKGKICLPPSCGTHKLTLVLDLDETLVHCTVTPIADPDLIFPVLFNGTLHQVYVRKRPYLDYFLETVAKEFEVVLFTASQKVYADVLLDKLDHANKYIKHRLFREACLLVQGNYLKDLTVLGRDVKKTVIVDNSPYAYAYHLSNGIPIESWYDDMNDTELLKLIGFLKRLHPTNDVRPVIRDHFKSHQLVDRARKGKPVTLSAPPF